MVDISDTHSSQNGRIGESVNAKYMVQTSQTIALLFGPHRWHTFPFSNNCLSAYSFWIDSYTDSIDSQLPTTFWTYYLDKLLKLFTQSLNFRPLLLVGRQMLEEEIQPCLWTADLQSMNIRCVCRSDILTEKRRNESIRWSAAEWHNSNMWWLYIKKTLYSPEKKDGKSISVVASACRVSECIQRGNYSW